MALVPVGAAVGHVAGGAVVDLVGERMDVSRTGSWGAVHRALPSKWREEAEDRAFWTAVIKLVT